jgi:hypothetical protein
VCDMLIWFSPVGCTSIRITTTLGYEAMFVCASAFELLEKLTCIGSLHGDRVVGSRGIVIGW